MLIRGISIPLNKLANKQEQWGILNSPNEINRIVNAATKKHLHYCKECFVNAEDSHACDLDPRSECGDIVRAVHDKKNKAIVFDVKVTDPYIENGLNTGKIKKTWSPYIDKVDYQDENGYLHGVDFGGITLTANPAYPECTFDIVYTASDDASDEEEENDTNDSDKEDTKDKKKNFGMNKKNETSDSDNVTISKKDYDAFMERLNKLESKKEPEHDENLKKNTNPKQDDKDMTQEPKNGEPEFVSMDQVRKMMEEKEIDTLKGIALNELRLVSSKLGIRDIDFDAMKALPIEQIQKLTNGYRAISSKIPDEPKTNKPDYYNEQTGQGVFDGSVSLTVGYVNDEGNWTDQV